MSILPAQTIKSMLSNGKLVVGGEESQVEAASYDLRIGTIFKDEKIFDGIRDSGESSITLPPGGMASIFTKEELDLPSDICATVFPINSQSSKGLLVLNPGHVDPGYQGAITVKILNISTQKITIRVDDPIFTAIFDRLESPTNEPYKNKQKSRKQREQEFSSVDINSSPDSLLKLIGKPNEESINSLIMRHWASKLAILSTVGALIFAIIAAFPVFQDARKKVTDLVEEQKMPDKASGGSISDDAPVVNGEKQSKPLAPNQGSKVGNAK